MMLWSVCRFSEAFYEIVDVCSGCVRIRDFWRKKGGWVERWGWGTAVA